MKKERPILFSAPMILAILAGQKTQTRRVAKKPVRHPDLGNFYTPGALVLEHEPKHVIERACPYGQPGGRLWVRETFFDASPFKDAPLFGAQGREFLYRASGDQIGCHKWTPSIHMPRVASRILLEIVGVRVERLHECSEADAVAEGCAGGHGSIPGYPYNAMAVEQYTWLWEKINGAGSWAANPWVWVVEFKRVEVQL